MSRQRTETETVILPSMKPMSVRVVSRSMNRRGMLARTGALLGTVSLGGCLDRYGIPGEAGEDTERPATLVDESFETIDAGCGQQTNEATVEFEDESVVVTGTIPGANACYVAELADASFDHDEGALDVTVASTEDSAENKACAECITELDYEAIFAFDGGLPATVTVVHEAMGQSETVATAESAESL